MSILRKDVNKILIKIKEGDKHSQGVLFEKTYNHLKAFVYPYVRNKNDVEDVLIEAYLRMFQYIHSFNPKKDGYNWMCEIAKNVAFDWNNKFNREVGLEDWEQNSQLPDIEESIIAKDEVQRLLQRYSKKDQKIIRMRFIDNKTFEEIAQACGMGKSNAHKRISKITKELLGKNQKKVEK